MRRLTTPLSIFFLAFSARFTEALPVQIHFSGTVSHPNCVPCTESDPFGGFFHVGDKFDGTIQYYPESAVVFRQLQDSLTLTTYFELPGASMSVFINGTVLTNDPTELLTARVGSWTGVSEFNIDAQLVPTTDAGKPEQVGPHGITEMALQLQDNTGASFGKTLTTMPQANSPIYSPSLVGLRDVDFRKDLNGVCALGACGGFNEGEAIADITSLSALPVPEPTTATLLLLGMLGCGWRQRC